MKSRTISTLAVLAALATLVTAGASARPTAPAQRQLTTVNVQDVAGIPYDYLRLGVYQGFFRKRGLDVKVQAAAGGAVIVPALVNGSIQFGGSNVVSSMLAKSRALPIKMIAPGTHAGGNPRKDDWAGVVVKRDSPIRTVQDLEGKTIATNTLRNVTEVTVKASLEKRGVDISKLKWLEVDFPQMHDALAADRVDAALIIEPFFYEAKKAGDRVIVQPYVGTRPGMQIGSYLTTESYIADHPATVRSFQLALADLSRWIARHPVATRKFLIAAAKLKRDTALHMGLPVWRTDVNAAGLQKTMDLMLKYGLLAKPIDVNDLIYRRR